MSQYAPSQRAERARNICKALHNYLAPQLVPLYDGTNRRITRSRIIPEECPMTGELSPIDKAKFAAAKQAAGLVESGMRVGMGTGSTAAWLVR